MAQYLIEVDERAITDQVTAILNQVFKKQMASKYSDVGDVLKAAVKDLVYDHKDEILDRIVDRAVKELVRKGLPLLLERKEVIG